MAQDLEEGGSGVEMLRKVKIGTGVWLAAAVLLLLFVAEPCGNRSAANCLLNLWHNQVGCMEANEIGDFLAGVFAPLAFLWLIAAVFLQREELSAQRKELRDSRAVAQQHVEEARKNVQFIGEQTKMLSEERTQALQTYADHQIDQCILQIDSLFSRIAGHVLATYVASGTKNRMFPIKKKEEESSAQYIMSSIANFDSSVKKHFCAENFIGLKKLQNIEVKKNFTAKLDAVVSAIEEINKVIDGASPSKRLQVSSLEFERMIKAYRIFKDA
ncbi:MAG: hypothetical protein RLO08_13185 [Parvibaculaceae bacterium]